MDVLDLLSYKLENFLNVRPAQERDPRSAAALDQVIGHRTRALLVFDGDDRHVHPGGR